MDMNLIYKSNSDHLQAEEIGNNMWPVTIQKIEAKEFEEGKQKLVLGFAETEKTLPLNVTNARSVEGMYGSDTDGWINQQIVLFTIMVDFQGKMVAGIRIRPPMQQQPMAPAQQPAPVFTPQPAPQIGPNTVTPAATTNVQYDDRNPPQQQTNNR